ncbi:MAG: ThiF family adenylyltransferase [Armatimonadetes bacterium]|nr:ThiF family adenylyltransferase [Armatimonadota bacterium]
MPLPLFRRYLSDLRQRSSGPLRCPVGISHWSGNLELIAASPGSEVGQVLLLAWTDTFALPDLLPPGCAGVLLLGRGQERGRALGVVRLPSQALDPLHRLRLVGPGMHTIGLRQEPLSEPPAGSVEGSPQGPMARWSRTIGALDGEVWHRLVGLRYAIVGVGRTGSSLALALVRLGVSHLTLIDPDHVEIHNLGESAGLTEADLGRPKVEAVAAALASLAATHPEVVTVPGSITSLQALHAAQACDLLVSCVDHDGARLAAAILATLFCKPLLEIATGVHGQGAARQLGADVRLVLPGQCLLCFGGLRDEAEARRVLASAEAERAFYAHRDWRSERAGSLASLNQCAVGVAQRLLEDLIAERIQESLWARLEFDASGRLAVSYPTVSLPHDRPPCSLCKLRGWGEEGLPHVAELFRQG